MMTNSFDSCVKIAACICAKDGIISQAEEETMHEMICVRFPEVEENAFEKSLQAFFDSDAGIEEYLNLVTEPELRTFVLQLAEASASADGLDPQENVALIKSREIWGISRDA
ncbi:hypothetical protein [Thalassoglobus polymorphus]|uniref:Tellurite resistance protein TerB n=1 Tax=Thalassoglobus polymorphus TaxID=2527994 RepID=A0A517QQL6_9PLAN|nr:hypothetical protein [Thalassoglobus polymorphus]QDT33927.1 hypothetical protein Mal48_31840 [Thalassoglobus polymorphus]